MRIFVWSSNDGGRVMLICLGNDAVVSTSAGTDADAVTVKNDLPKY